MDEAISLHDPIMQEAFAAMPLIEKKIEHIYPELNPTNHLHILIPNLLSEGETRTEAERLSHNWGKAEYICELAQMCREIGYSSTVHLLRKTDYREEICKIPENAALFNMCDGGDIEGVPGPSVALFLENSGRRFYGCNYRFMSSTSSKKQMKETFINNNVSTAKYVVVTPECPLTEESVAHMTYPFFVKASNSYGSVGLSEDSVVNNFEEAREQVQRMLQVFDELVVEEFILGTEW